MLKIFSLLCAAVLLILDSRCAMDSAREALELCGKTLIPGLFPLFVLSAMLTPGLASVRIPFLSKLLGIPDGSEGVWLLGCAGGYPVGAASVCQAYRSGSLDRTDAQRMLGLCSLCGPSFLFGAAASILSIKYAVLLFLIQLEASILVGTSWPGKSDATCHPGKETISLTEAVRRSVGSMLSVCAWVTLAAVTAGMLRRWLFPLLPSGICVLLTGLLELTNGVFSVATLPDGPRFLHCALFLSFGGASVLLQIHGLASAAGLSMVPCIAQKSIQALLTVLISALCLRFGTVSLVLPLLLVFPKIAVAFPGKVLYNIRRKEGI